MSETPASFPRREELDPVLRLLAREAPEYLAGLDARPVLSPSLEEALARFSGPLPERGIGAEAAVKELVEGGREALAHTSGPRCYHFVIGGSTPAAMGADWYAGLTDQIAYTWIVSPLGVRLEQLALDWLKALFGLPAEMAGIMTTGATMSNFVGLAAARQWWGRRHGVDVSQEGMTGMPVMPVLTSGFVHASSVKVLAMLGVGRRNIRRHARDAAGRLDLTALARTLDRLDGAPAVIIANAGEVNAGEFDPIEDMAELARAHGAWLHVDGAFGLFARLSPRTEHLVRGVEGADSVTVDGHKWLNVPHDCGFSFVRDTAAMAESFAYSADYLADPDDARPTYGGLGPESSRRARGLAVWATLRAYGRAGYRALVERHLDLARHMADTVDAAPDLERLAEVGLNIVCFRYNPGGLDDAALDALNQRLGEAIAADGRFLAGATRMEGRVALRPAISNWRTRPEDVEAFVAAVRELGGRLAAGD